MRSTLNDLVSRAPADIQKKFIFKNYTEGSHIIFSDNAANYLYIIQSGIVEVLKESYKGDIMVVNTFSENSFFGEIELFCPDLSPYHVRAKTACRIILVKKKDFLEWMKIDFNFTIFFCEVLTRRLYLTSDLMSRIALLPLKGRVLYFIHLQYVAGTLDRLTKNTLVFQVSAPRRSVNRVIKQCIEEGIIGYKDKKFVVLDEESLSEYALEYKI